MTALHSVAVSREYQRIGLFGGTFDPPRVGHLVTAVTVRFALGLDLVVLNAGTYAPMRADAFDLASMNEHFAINYQGVVNALATVSWPATTNVATSSRT